MLHKMSNQTPRGIIADRRRTQPPPPLPPHIWLASRSSIALPSHPDLDINSEPHLVNHVAAIEKEADVELP